MHLARTPSPHGDVLFYSRADGVAHDLFFSAGSADPSKAASLRTGQAAAGERREEDVDSVGLPRIGIANERALTEFLRRQRCCKFLSKILTQPPTLI
jgi:hypothetical protein